MARPRTIIWGLGSAGNRYVPIARSADQTSGTALAPAFEDAEHGAALLFGLTTSLTLLLWMAAGDSPLRYVIYTVPMTVGIAWLLAGRGNPSFSTRAVAALSIFGLLVFATTLLNGTTPFTARDLLIVLGYLTLFCLMMRTPAWIADITLFAMFIGLNLEAAKNGVSLHLSILNSEGLIESALAMPIGLLVLYFYRKGDWVRFAVSAILLIIAFKRISLLAVFLSVGLDILYRWVLRRDSISRGAVVACLVLCSLVAINLQFIFSTAQVVFNDSELSANRLTLGRYDIANILWQRWEAGGPFNTLLGFGVGATDAALAEKMAGILPHNDWLKIMIDYGVVGVAAFWAILLLIFNPSPLANLFCVYTAVIMMTDNVFIYIFYFMFVHQLLQIDDGLVRKAERQRAAT